MPFCVSIIAAQHAANVCADAAAREHTHVAALWSTFGTANCATDLPTHRAALFSAQQPAFEATHNSTLHSAHC